MAPRNKAADGARLPDSGKSARSAILVEVLRNVVFFVLTASIAWVLVAGAGNSAGGGAPLPADALCIHRPAGG
jgi:hypothetical protein